MKIAAVLLAAGASTRLGRPKQLVRFLGLSLVRTLTEELLESRCTSVAVVTGAHVCAVRSEVSELGATVLLNPHWEEGMASSIRLGASWAMKCEADAVLLAVVDQIFLRRGHINALLAAYQARPGICASRYQDVLGVPAIFDRSAFPELLALRGAEGARTVVRNAAELSLVEWPEGAFDLDTPEDLARVEQRTSASCAGSAGFE